MDRVGQFARIFRDTSEMFLLSHGSKQLKDYLTNLDSVGRAVTSGLALTSIAALNMNKSINALGLETFLGSQGDMENIGEDMASIGTDISSLGDEDGQGEYEDYDDMHGLSDDDQEAAYEAGHDMYEHGMHDEGPYEDGEELESMREQQGMSYEEWMYMQQGDQGQEMEH